MEVEVYVNGAVSEKYRTYGAPMEWHSLFIAQALQRYIEESKFENLEWVHIEIFEACLQQPFDEDEIEKWLEIFSALKRYFFVSLCDRDFSTNTIEILKKFFCHPSMQLRMIDECRDIFIRTLTLLYQPDCEQECMDNMRDFLEFLHECDESSYELKSFVYEVIKYFAEQKKKAYQLSNLIDLMNRVVELRRGEIFMPSETQSEAAS